MNLTEPSDIKRVADVIDSLRALQERRLQGIQGAFAVRAWAHLQLAGAALRLAAEHTRLAALEQTTEIAAAQLRAYRGT